METQFDEGFKRKMESYADTVEAFKGKGRFKAAWQGRRKNPIFWYA